LESVTWITLIESPFDFAQGNICRVGQIPGFYPGSILNHPSMRRGKQDKA